MSKFNENSAIDAMNKYVSKYPNLSNDEKKEVINTILKAIVYLINVNINNAFTLYAMIYTSLTQNGKRKIIDIFLKSLNKYMQTKNIDVLSDYAAITVNEPGYEIQYFNISTFIQNNLGNHIS